MSLEERVSRYISSAEKVFRQMAVTKASVDVDSDKVREVVEWARAYFEDAKHYREKKKFEVSLTSVAYCEGLLDALRLLGTVKFAWPKTVKRVR